ncbi:MAG: hypothetical protein LBB40_05475, partial [Holophagales bacterium]|nr:hypothetical protein [Holophagales bacterium]
MSPFSFSREQKRAKRAVRVLQTAAAALILTPAAIGALNAQEPEITGPLNPAFIKWQAEQKQRLALR